ncbi:uncharacterized protein LOC113287858 [Papaver somniferum]|uniref:uncharacterized protein LOC113287858 n=1 Tax=Papaver somniferum TaxID=3469 RepID=UPI000E70542E|nr:uncharacterized protein LOC113287858 [Papaver somniferum]XP_026392502.1 uncharacterized protein LOC113287858 [Papaver somniferum]XP_026392503.1 uncharacterized protein LOC113287858 [Papaver somniferum]XP_026392504.1 uncharacterized protein LOC113287858 [Papaver somniferum]
MHMMGIERILSSEHDHLKQENSTADSFVVDIDNLSQVTLHDIDHHHQHHRDINTPPNSNTNFQRSLSRKVSSQRGVGNGGGGGGAENESSNKEIGFVNGDVCVSANKLMSTFVDLPQVVMASNVSSSVETTQNMININVNQKMVTVAAAESNNNSKLMKKRSHSKHHNQMKSSSQPRNWMMDPRRILFFFASLSSMGTIILIYFTLSIGKFSGDVSDA